MGKMKGLTALLVAGGFVCAGIGSAADIGITALKYIAIDKESAAGKSKTVYVAKVPQAAKNSNDVNDIAVELSVKYTGESGNAEARFEVPSGESVNKGPGWLVNKESVAKYVNKESPGGPTGAKVVVIKPTKLLKLIAKTRGDSTELDMIGAGAPAGSVFTAYSITSGAITDNFCSEFSGCSFKEIGGGTGRKLVCKGSAADGSCEAAGPPPTQHVYTFTTGIPAGVCGVAKNGGAGGADAKLLNCGGLNIGGGASTVFEGPTPDNAPTQFNAACNLSGVCSITARTAAQTGTNTNCSDTGCQFGPFLSISNGALSTCVTNTFGSPGNGTLTLASGNFTGSIPLSSSVRLTGNASQPCPPCVAGLCVGGSNNGNACASINGANDTYDCPASGTPLGLPFAVNLTPISSGTVSQDTGGTGLFCPSQTTAGAFGCPNNSPPGICPSGLLADYIETTGSSTPLALGGSHNITLASIFCIPAVEDPPGIIDLAANLPGPGQTSLPGTGSITP